MTTRSDVLERAIADVVLLRQQRDLLMIQLRNCSNSLDYVVEQENTFPRHIKMNGGSLREARVKAARKLLAQVEESDLAHRYADEVS